MNCLKRLKCDKRMAFFIPIISFIGISGAWYWYKHVSSASYEPMLRTVEKKILSFLKTPYRGWYVDIGPTVGEADKIWTVSMRTEVQKTPIVLLHGMGAGVALWVLNLDALAKHRPVYAIDLLGFGRSSRPEFSSDAAVAEKQMINSIEKWRREANIKEMILLGHSFGGFLATGYTISYPDRVKHLILADPWGFPERPEKISAPLWVRGIASLYANANPLWILRTAGPYGQWVVQKTRQDILRNFNDVARQFTSEEDKDSNIIAQYIHLSNAQNPTGESAFHAMMSGFGWAKNPMLNRIHELREDKTITFLYGSRSWIRRTPADTIKEKRKNSYVDIKMIEDASHHVYADRPDIFNQYVNEACEFSDSSSE